MKKTTAVDVMMDVMVNPYSEAHPIYIFEGPDNSGKDTLISKLKAHIWNISHRTTLEIHPKFEKDIDYKDYFGWECIYTLADIRHLKERTIIFNRFFYSEYVYGPIYRNYTPNCQEDFEDALLEMKRPIVLIYTYARPEILRTREDGLSFSTGDLNKISKELKLYENVIDKSKLYVIKVDTSSCDPDKDFEYIKKKLSDFSIKIF